ncbi:MAG: hypothetical protein JST87_05465 [Bacteroidetes bacterium]|nr:hypothetical protein [Bacteroidota bacterium]
MDNNQIQKRSLPKIDDLYANIELASKFNDLNKLLNCAPKAEWVKENKFANNAKYLSIATVEYLLTSIFTKWRVEIKSCQVVANSVVVAVRLFVLDPITGEWDWQDGIGASPIQTKQGAAATDFTQVTTAAVQMAAPAAESYAFKDAAEKFGKIFGKDLNRKDEMNYAPMQEKKFEKVAIPDELKSVIESTEEQAKLTEIFNTNKEYHSNPEFMQLLNKRKEEIKKMQLNGSVVNG